MSERDSILLGFEIGSGEPVRIPYAHTVVCGQTQASGKTTTLEGLLSRTGDPPRPALAFLTKQAESAFAEARRIPPYFHDRADWQFVESILEAMMREKMKYQREWIIRVCQGAHSLEQVARNVEAALTGKKRKAASGYAAGMYLQLSEYFKLLMPELARLKLNMRGSKLGLDPGLSVMDLSDYSTEMQSLAIASAMEEVYKRRGVITVVPEAWEFMPQGRNTPVKLAGISLARKGSAGGNFLWLDSQDITGVEKFVLKQVAVWILGVQREINEVEKTISQMPVPRTAKPKPEEVMQLRRGEFFVSYGDTLKRVYVLPAWLPESKGTGIAKLLASSPKSAETLIRALIAEFQPKHHRREDEHVDYKAAYEEAQETIGELKQQIEKLERKIGTIGETLSTSKPNSSQIAAATTQAKSLGLVDDAEEVALSLDVKRPVIDVTKRKYVLELDDENTQGRLALLLSEGFFDQARRIQDCYPEFRARGWMKQTGAPTPLNLPLGKLTEMGFMRIVGTNTYQAIPGMKVNVREVEVA